MTSASGESVLHGMIPSVVAIVRDTIGARIQTRRLHTMSALKGKLFAFHINAGHRLRLFINGLVQLLCYGCYLRPAPQLALVASRAFFWIYLYNLQFLLLIE